MRKLLFIIVPTLILLASCVGNGKERTVLDKAESIINEYPDSALTMLDSLALSADDFSKSNLRRWQLLHLMAQNKCDTVFRSDSLQQALTAYYDHHGTPNERMMAHYLLGRAYSDMGEAPRALQCFQDAAACADTTSMECDFNTYFRIFGQIAMIYRAQCMPDKELAAWNQYSRYALKSGDIYNYIHGKEMSIGSYYDMGDTLSCLRITEQCRQEYARHGMSQEAASVFPSAIYIHLLNSNYAKAREMMEVFDKESGLFDSLGNIQKGRESYYYSKGVYFMGIHKNDSAELYLRKLEKYHFNHDFQANKGLLSLFRMKNNIDSISKYASLYEKSVDDIFIENQAEAVAQAAAFNKYSRIQKESEELAVKAEKSRWMSRLLFILFLLIVAVSAFVIMTYKRKQKEKVEALGIAYTNLMSEYRQAFHEAESLKADKVKALKEKEDELVRMKSKLEEMESLFKGLSPEMKVLTLTKSDIVKRFKDMIIPRIPPVAPCQKDWKLLKETMEYTNPNLYERITYTGNLTQQEIYTCLLTALHFSSGELAVLLCISKQRVSNLKASANYKLFNDKNAKTLLANLKKM